MDWANRRERFRATLNGGRCIPPAGVYDPTSARIAEDLGFEAGMLAGSVASLAVLGAPDIVLLTLTEFAEQAYRINRAGKLPLLVDADHGYGNALNVKRTGEEPHTPRAGRRRRVKACEEAGVDMLFMAGVKSRAELDEVASAVKRPLFLGSAGKDLYDLDYLSARNVRVCLQGHSPFMAAVNAVHATLKALRDGTPSWELQNISPPSDLMKRATRQADYAAWTKDFLNANPKA